MKSVLFRVDGSHNIGIGHVKRCLAFAKGLEKEGIKSIFVLKNINGTIFDLINNCGFYVELIPDNIKMAEDASCTVEYSSKYMAKLIISDLSHSLNLERKIEYINYFKQLSKAKTFMLTIDDIDKVDYQFDIQIIPYFGAERLVNKTQEKTKLLLGPSYFIFQQDYIDSVNSRKVIRKNAKNVLITMGGSDPSGITVKVLESLEFFNLDDIDVRIVVGECFDPLVKSKIFNLTKDNINFNIVTNSNSICKHILWSDICVIAGGLTKYEMAITGTPSIIISPFEFEASRCEEFVKAGSSIHIGQVNFVDKMEIIKNIKSLLNDFKLREMMFKSGKKMVDGKGIERIIREIPKEVLI